MDSQYIIIKLVKDLPHPSFPRVFFVPETWISVFFKKNDKVAVILPAEEFSITENRIKAKEKPEKLKWSLKIAVMLFRADDYDNAYETAYELNRQAMQEDQPQLANSQEVVRIGEIPAAKEQQNERTSNADSKKNEEVRDIQQENENEMKGNSQQNSVELEKKSTENQRQSDVESEKYSAENLPQSENGSEENQTASESELEENQQENTANVEKDSAKNLPQSENNQSEEDEHESENESDENPHQSTVELEDNSADTQQQNETDEDEDSAKNLRQSDNNQSEEDEHESENESDENPHQSTVELEDNSADTQQQNETDEDENYQQLISENNFEESSSESWHPKSSDESYYLSTEESEQSSDEKSKRPKKRGNHGDTEYQVNHKKRKLMKNSYSNDLNPPSTSKGTQSTSQKRSNLNKKKEKRITIRKFLKRLSLVCKILDEKFSEFYGHLQFLGSIFNTLIELHSKFLSLHALLFSGDDSVDPDSSSKLESGNNSGFQTSEKINEYVPSDNKQQNNNNADKNYNANCDFRSNSKSTDLNYSTPAYEYPDNTDKSMKWTLIHEEFKPKLGLVELMPGSGIYLGEEGLQMCLKEAKEARYEPCYNKLAKLLLFEIFKTEAIRQCSLFPKKKKDEKLRLDHYASCILMLFVKDFCLKRGLGEEMDEQLTIKALQKKMYAFKYKCIDLEQYG